MLPAAAAPPAPPPPRPCPSAAALAPHAQPLAAAAARLRLGGGRRCRSRGAPQVARFREDQRGGEGEVELIKDIKVGAGGLGGWRAGGTLRQCATCHQHSPPNTRHSAPCPAGGPASGRRARAQGDGPRRRARHPAGGLPPRAPLHLRWAARHRPPSARTARLPAPRAGTSERPPPRACARLLLGSAAGPALRRGRLPRPPAALRLPLRPPHPPAPAPHPRPAQASATPWWAPASSWATGTPPRPCP
jgi:hypothetical protein